MEKEFIQLINNHSGILYKVCNAYFFRDPNKDDYAQEILIRLWKAYPHFKNQSRFSTWMYRVALNAAIDILRKFNNQPKLSGLNDKITEIPDPESRDMADRDKLYDLINHLDISEKAIILMYLDEFSYEEIAETMGITKNNAGVKINRIKNKLIKLSEHHGS